MTYKIETFKSKSYQKILKAVLKFRYPDKSYEEALREESKLNNCIMYIENWTNLFISQSNMNILDKVTEDSWYDVTCDGGGIPLRYEEFTAIFGRPITICEVVDVLQSLSDIKNKQKLDEYKKSVPIELNLFVKVLAEQSIANEKSIFYYQNGKLYFNHNRPYRNQYIDLMLNKYVLHEQPQETIDEIAELLNDL